VAWCAISGCVITNFVLDRRSSNSEEELPESRRKLIMAFMAVFARTHALCGGCIWSQNTRVKVDYSKYLGPDYEYRYEGAGIHVCNHLHMNDIIHGIYMMRRGGYQASFIGKRELTEVPLLGKLVRPLESLLVGRDSKDSKEQTDSLLKLIQDRQINAE